MVTLAHELGETTPVSYVVKKAQRLGILGLDEAVGVAFQRGCRHYSPANGGLIKDPGRSCFSDEELVVFLISGEHAYTPTAIRCAAQLIRAPHVDPVFLAKLSMKLKCDRVLRSIAHAGSKHDQDGRLFWTKLLATFPEVLERKEPKLPHWSRYVSMAGIQRDGMTEPQWLTPRDQPSAADH